MTRPAFKSLHYPSPPRLDYQQLGATPSGTWAVATDGSLWYFTPGMDDWRRWA